MTTPSLHNEDIVNTALEPILTRAITRFRALLPREVELVVDMVNDDIRIRAYARQLEESLLSACLIAWQSMGVNATQIIVELKDVLLDDIVLDPQAETLQGGLPPRKYAWLVISNSARNQAGPFSTVIAPPGLMDESPSSARRLKLHDIREVVDQHRGWVTAAPEVGKGTAFDIFLPTAQPLDIAAVDASGSGVKHIIYVDDYEAMRELVGETLPDAGFEVTCFESGKAALQAMLETPTKYAAVVSDYKLQGLTGVDLLNQLRNHQIDVPSIIISGYVDDALRTQATAAGASMVISKNIDLGELCTALRSMLMVIPNPALVTYSEWARL